MAGRLTGGRELRARLAAVGQSLTPIGREWADKAVRIGQPAVPVRTGRLRDSIRRRTANKTRAVVEGHYSAYFVDHGVKPHSTAKGSGRGPRTIFQRRMHPGYPARPFRDRMAWEALGNHLMLGIAIRAWNRAR